MPISIQRRIGFVLTVTAVAALAVYCSIVVTHSSAVGTPQVGSGPGFVVIGQQIHSDISPLYVIPIVICGAVGLILLLWPTRKPPRLPRRVCDMKGLPPNQSPEPTAVGAGRSAVAVHVASRRWLSFLR
jgi:hypothetical protein